MLTITSLQNNATIYPMRQATMFKRLEGKATRWLSEYVIDYFVIFDAI